MFTLATERTFSWPVTVKVPVDGGQFADAPFDCTYKLVEQDELEAVIAGKVREADFLMKTVVGWKGVHDAAGAELPFSLEALERMVRIPYARSAMMTGYYEAMAGARRKN